MRVLMLIALAALSCTQPVVEPSAAVSAALPRQRAIPFEAGDVWRGDYLCSQGRTGLELHIVAVDGMTVHAVFDFEHTPSSAAGSYKLRGVYDAATRSITFEPGLWITRPVGYVTVGMTGTVAGRPDVRGRDHESVLQRLPRPARASALS